MKKIMMIMMVGLLLTTLVGCGSKDTKSEAKSKIDQIKEKGVLVMGTSADYPPYETYAIIDGKEQIVGFDVEIAKAIAKELGVELKVEDMDFDALLVTLNDDKVDMVIAGMSATEERAKAVDFSNIYYNPTQKIVVRKSDINSLNTLEAFQGKYVGVQKGTIQEEFANTHLANSEKIALAKIPALILELKGGKVDGVVLEEPVAMSYVSQNEDLAIAEAEVAIDSDNGSSVAVKKGNTELVNLINQVIEKLIAEKKIEQMVIDVNKLLENQ